MNIFEFIKEQRYNASSIIFEIGAHFGIDTEKIYGLTDKAQIHCFEPDPRNFKMLIQREINKIAFINNVAISDSIGEATFYLSNGKVNTGDKLFDENDWSASSSLKKPLKHLQRHPWCKFDNQIKVPTITLDKYCEFSKVNKIDLIWCDVQGAEDLVLSGAKSILRRTSYIYTEFCNEELYQGEPNLETILKLLPGWTMVFVDGENILLRRVI